MNVAAPDDFVGANLGQRFCGSASAPPPVQTPRCEITPSMRSRTSSESRSSR
jgi:hypothetical protein